MRSITDSMYPLRYYFSAHLRVSAPGGIVVLQQQGNNNQHPAPADGGARTAVVAVIVAVSTWHSESAKAEPGLSTNIYI